MPAISATCCSITSASSPAIQISWPAISSVSATCWSMNIKTARAVRVMVDQQGARIREIHASRGHVKWHIAVHDQVVMDVGVAHAIEVDANEGPARGVVMERLFGRHVNVDADEAVLGDDVVNVLAGDVTLRQGPAQAIGGKADAL